MLMSMLTTYEYIHLTSDGQYVITSGHTAHNQSTHLSNSALQYALKCDVNTQQASSLCSVSF